MVENLAVKSGWDEGAKSACGSVALKGKGVVEGDGGDGEGWVGCEGWDGWTSLLGLGDGCIGQREWKKVRWRGCGDCGDGG